MHIHNCHQGRKEHGVILDMVGRGEVKIQRVEFGGNVECIRGDV